MVRDGTTPNKGRSKPKGRRKRGGQPRNTNALRHGFYSKHFSSLEAEAIGGVAPTLIDEIAMLRVAIERVFNRATELLNRDAYDDDGQVRDFNFAQQSLSSLGIATTRLSHMLRTQRMLEGHGDDPLEDLISEALLEID